MGDDHMKVFGRYFLCVLLLLLSFGLCFASAGQEETVFQVEAVQQQTIEGKDCVAVVFSRPLDSRKNINPHFSITLKDGSPAAGAWALTKDAARAYFVNIEPDTVYTVLVKKGLRSRKGDTLEKDAQYEIATRAIQPMIAFGSSGHILPWSRECVLPVDTVNIDKADIDFFRIRPEKIHVFRQNFARQKKLYYHESNALQKISDLVYSGRWDLDVKKNLRTRVNLPISHIRELETPGLYFAVIRGAGVYDYGYSTVFFSVSDIGLQARMYKNSIQVFAQRISNGDFLSRIMVEGFDAKGHLLFEGLTDKKGIYEYRGNTGEAALIAARSKGKHTGKNKGQITFLSLDMPALDLSLFHMGDRAARPVELFVYGPRNLYRPGETLVLEGLLRDHDGKMVPPLPIEAKIFTPDGRIAREFIWKGDGMGHYFREYGLSDDALTGQWQVVFSGAGNELARYDFLVSEFLPERMELAIGNPGKKGNDGQGDVILKHQDLAVAAQGRYLYGAAAENCRVDAMVHVSPERELFREMWPGFEFGNASNLVNRSFSSPEIFLDDEGKGILDIPRQWDEISSPHRISANVSLHEDSGKPVVRRRVWQVWPAPSLVGVRCAAEDRQVQQDSVVNFEIVVLNRYGQSLPMKGVQVKLIREIREYFWEFANEHWQWKWSSRFVPVESLSLDLSGREPAGVSFPVEYGPYRLEATHPESGFMTSCDIYAGWQPEGNDRENLNRPDRIDLTLDRKHYESGETVHLTLKSPQKGTGYVFVEADTNLATFPMEFTKGNNEMSFVVQPEWNSHNIYVSALVVHSEHKTSGDKRLPKRSVGLVRLPLNREYRKLDLDIQLPKKMMPGQKIRVPVQVAWASESDGIGGVNGGGGVNGTNGPDGDKRELPQDVYVGLAAVDTGILNVTDFQTPDPFGYFFEGRRYGVHLYDMYQKLIKPNDGSLGTPRFGGDIMALSRVGGQMPSTDVRIISLHCLPVKADASGMAVFYPEIPDFNGELRFMAFAWTRDSFGKAEHKLTLASPLVTSMTMPRFLAAGDEAAFFLGLHNLTDMDQRVSIDLAADGPVKIASETAMQIRLDPGQRKTLEIQARAGQGVGRSRIFCKMGGIRVPKKKGRGTREISLNPSWFIETRSAWPVMTDHMRTAIAPGKNLLLPKSNFQGMVPETLGVQGEISLFPCLNIAAHIRELWAYPYGCLEQVISSMFPHVLLSKKDFSRLGIEARMDMKDGEEEREADIIAAGLQQILERQKYNGGFALWDARGQEDPWLTAYAGHFLLEAFQAGYEPGKTAMDQLTKRLVTYVRNPKAILPPYGVKNAKAYRAITQAYAAYVLARMKSLTLGDARSFYQREQGNIPTPLGHVQAAMALYLAGDRSMSEKALENSFAASRKAQKQSGRHGEEEQWFGDYGSALRDDAMAFYLVGQHYPGYPGLKTWLKKVNKQLDNTHWFSTQERNALVMAGAQLSSMKTETWQADVLVDGSTTVMRNNRPASFGFFRGKAAGGLEIRNPGDKELFVSIDVTGAPKEKPGLEQRKAKIKKRFLNMNGQPVSGSTFHVGDRVIVELQFMGEVPLHNGLVVDLLPAGFELEDPNLPNSPDISRITVDGQSISQWQSNVRVSHSEYRDDRFAAAVSMGADQWKRLYYLMRATGQGSFLNPVPLLEDMYNPSIRAVGDGGAERMVIAP
ncbi:MAG: hypothetical protein CR981_03520 [Proteobacteria bacterium]|nr:MAG: hypothetical protein CR981_03520 [Pseudomonadota bacterium]